MLLARAEDVAGVHEADQAEPLPVRRAELAVEHHATHYRPGEPLRIQRLDGAEPIEREPADRGIAAGEEALGGGQVLHHVQQPLAVGAEDRIAVLVHPRQLVGEAVGQADAGAARRPRTAAGQAPIDEALQERLHEAHLGTVGPGRHRGIDAEHRAARAARARRRASRGARRRRTSTAGPAGRAGRSAVDLPAQSARRRARCSRACSAPSPSVRRRSAGRSRRGRRRGRR